MSYQALARKWRPKTFVELVGQEHVVTALTNALKTQRLHHAYLFTGTRGVGKTTLARILAKSLNCDTGITPTPCGTCSACTLIDSGSFVDLLEVDAATNTRVEEMRELLDNTQYMPTVGRFKVYIIDEVHMLSRSAFNSMLKTLEEPPEHVKFILATTDPQKVPVTVLSRCLQFNLKQMSRESIARHLETVLAAEKAPFEAAALEALGRAAQGSMRDSLSLLDQAIAYGAGEVTARTVATMLGAIDQSYLFNLLECVATRDGKGLMEEAERMAERSVSFDSALQELATILHQIAAWQVMPQVSGTGVSECAKVEKLADIFSPEDVQLFYQIVIVGRRDLPLAPDEFSGFTMALMRMLAFFVDASPNRKMVARSNSTRFAPTAGKSNIEAKESRFSEGVPTEEAVEPSSGLDKSSKGGSISFDGDWLRLAANLKLAGMAGMLATHCEFKSLVGNRIELSVPAEYKHLAEKGFIDKLRSALANYFCADISLQVTVGESSGNSLAEVEERGRQAKQAEAFEAIGCDVFVQELKQNLDARVIESSVRSVQQ